MEQLLNLLRDAGAIGPEAAKRIIEFHKAELERDREMERNSAADAMRVFASYIERGDVPWGGE